MKLINKAGKSQGKTGAAGISWKREFHRNLPLYMLVLPAAILAIIFCYIPMAGLIMAFQNYQPIMGFLKSKWIISGRFLNSGNRIRRL